MKFAGVLVVGLLIGLAGGLIYTWFLAPIQYYDIYPPLLASQYRQDWIRMTAWAYAVEANWERTQTRLLNIPPGEVRSVIADVLERAVADARSNVTLQRLAHLASEYQVNVPAVGIYAEGGTLVVPAVSTQPPASPTPTPALVATSPLPTATPTLTSVATATPTPVLEASVSGFEILSQTLTCDPLPSIAVSLEISRTVEEEGRERQELVGVPMREVWLIWDGGADRALTGFKPDRGLGYADFDVEPGRIYNLYLDIPTGPPLLRVQVEPCMPNEGTGWTSRSLLLRKEELPPATETPTPTVTPTP